MGKQKYFEETVGKLDSGSFNEIEKVVQNARAKLNACSVPGAFISVCRDYSDCYYEGDEPTLKLVLTYEIKGGK